MFFCLPLLSHESKALSMVPLTCIFKLSNSLNSSCNYPSSGYLISWFASPAMRELLNAASTILPSTCFKKCLLNEYLCCPVVVITTLKLSCCNLLMHLYKRISTTYMSITPWYFWGCIYYHNITDAPQTKN